MESMRVHHIVRVFYVIPALVLRPAKLPDYYDEVEALGGVRDWVSDAYTQSPPEAALSFSLSLSLSLTSLISLTILLCPFSLIL